MPVYTISTNKQQYVYTKLNELGQVFGVNNSFNKHGILGNVSLISEDRDGSKQRTS